jgi:hypothetical protein
VGRRHPRSADVLRAAAAAPQYATEEKALRATSEDEAQTAPLRRNVVYVLVDRYDLAAARAVQYARSLNPAELRAVHFDVDPLVTRELESTWEEVGSAQPRRSR